MQFLKLYIVPVHIGPGNQNNEGNIVEERPGEEVRVNDDLVGGQLLVGMGLLQGQGVPLTQPHHQVTVGLGKGNQLITIGLNVESQDFDQNKMSNCSGGLLFFWKLDFRYCKCVLIKQIEKNCNLTLALQIKYQLFL